MERKYVNLLKVAALFVSLVAAIAGVMGALPYLVVAANLYIGALLVIRANFYQRQLENVSYPTPPTLTDSAHSDLSSRQLASSQLEPFGGLFNLHMMHEHRKKADEMCREMQASSLFCTEVETS